MPKALLSFLLVSLPLCAQLPAASHHTIEADVTLRDYSHPKHADDFHEERLKLTIAADTDRDALALTFRSGQEPPDRFVLRGSELFQVTAAALEPAESAGDLRALTLAKLDPLYVASLIAEKRENARRRIPSSSPTATRCGAFKPTAEGTLQPSAPQSLTISTAISSRP